MHTERNAFLSRRAFVKGVAATTAAAGAGALAAPAWGAAADRLPQATLSGSEFDLRIGETLVNVTGRARTALTVNGSLPGPVLEWREGDTVTIRVTNTLDEDTSIHWHGILLPANMDGVPGLSFPGIRPGETFTYRFPVRQSGTYWYHSHSGFQEQRGLYAPLVIRPADSDAVRADREHTLILTDWTDEAPERVFAKLKKQSDYYNFRQRTVGDFFSDVRRDGFWSTFAARSAWGRMRMNDRDLADVTGATYTYLLNGLPPSEWTGLFQHGERVRLRLINGSAMTYFDVRIPGVRLTVVAADGLPVRPVQVDELRIAVAETYDVVVEPAGGDAFTIFAQAMDRTGFAAGTLAVREGLRTSVPALDSRVSLTMADMGHHAGDAHAGQSVPAPSAADPHAGHVMPAAPDPHAGHVMPAATVTHPASERSNPLVDMQVQSPASKLSEPGIGLGGHGRRVLTYADLVSSYPDPDGREPDRTIELHLTGHMQRFAWSFDGVKFSDAEPIQLAYGERVRFVFVNDTMMTHPIHLHGMWSDLEDDMGQFLVRKHTIEVPAGSRRSVRVTADAPGRWAFHCHLLFHMEAGMFREVRVEEGGSHS